MYASNITLTRYPVWTFLVMAVMFCLPVSAGELKRAGSNSGLTVTSDSKDPFSIPKRECPTASSLRTYSQSKTAAQLTSYSVLSTPMKSRPAKIEKETSEHLMRMRLESFLHEIDFVDASDSEAKAKLEKRTVKSSKPLDEVLETEGFMNLMNCGAESIKVKKFPEDIPDNMIVKWDDGVFALRTKKGCEGSDLYMSCNRVGKKIIAIWSPHLLVQQHDKIVSELKAVAEEAAIANGYSLDDESKEELECSLDIKKLSWKCIAFDTEGRIICDGGTRDRGFISVEGTMNPGKTFNAIKTGYHEACSGK